MVLELGYFPDRYLLGGLLYRIDQQKLYRNTGTFAAPVWDEIGAVSPAGTITMFGGVDANIPTGWIRCDGASLSTTTFDVLFAAIGYEWGGSGANFNVPDFETNNLFPRAADQDSELAQTGGESTHVLTESELAQHTHIQNSHSHGTKGNTDVSGTTFMSFNAISNMENVETDSTVATNQNTGSDSAHENKPPYASVYYIIKT